MKQNSRIISIPKPCHEDWDAMTPAQQGRYCAACQKTVIDFTLMTDGQVLDVFKKAKDNPPCGSFLNSQLDRPLIDTRYQPSFISQLAKRAAAILLLLPATTSALWAQQVKKQNKTTQQASKSKPAAKQGKQIRGRVVDADSHAAVAGVTVEILTFRLSAVTDSAGMFIISLPDSIPDASIVLDGRKGNRETFARAVDPKNSEEQTLYLKSAAATAAITTVNPQGIRTMGGAQATDLVAMMPGMYQRQRGVMGGATSTRSNETVYVIDGVQMQDADHISNEGKKPTLWQRMTKPFRKKHTNNETK